MRIVELLIAAALLGQTPQNPGASGPAGAPPAGTSNSMPRLRASARCAPYYPPLAIRLNHAGTTVLDIDVTPQGTIANVNVAQTSGFSELDAAAIACSKTWTYSPATQNGAAVEGRTKNKVVWSLDGGGPPGFFPASYPAPPPGPPGWSEDRSSEFGGMLAYYKLTNSDDPSNQFMSAGISGGYANLENLIDRNHELLEQINGAQIVGEAKITICGSETAWQLEYTRPMPIPASPNRMMNFEQVASVRNGYAYFTGYIRPPEAAKRPEAEQWIRSYCDSEK